jgi:hypothetical protein
VILPNRYIIDHNNYVRFEIFTAVAMKNGVVWDVTPCGSCNNRRFGGLSTSIIRVTRINELGITLVLVTANVPSSTILVTLMMEALSSSETSILRRTTWRNIPKDAILHNNCVYTVKYLHRNITSSCKQETRSHTCVTNIQSVTATLIYQDIFLKLK